MNDQDYIRRAAELADGWRFDKKYSPFASVLWGPNHLQGPITSDGIKDALACQLIRQANAVCTHGKFDYRGDPMDPITAIVDWAEHRGGLNPVDSRQESWWCDSCKVKHWSWDECSYYTPADSEQNALDAHDCGDVLLELVGPTHYRCKCGVDIKWSSVESGHKS